MKVLVLGGGGQVANAVVAAAGEGREVLVRSRAQLDIGDEKAVADALAETRAQWIINAAAYTAVDLAEDHPAQAIAVNDTAVGVLASAATASACRLLHLSTDFVFDGQSNRAYLPGDQPNPLSVYGTSKLGGERQALRGATGIVLRTAWVYAAAGKNFVLTMLRLMQEKEQVSVVSDQIGTPTWAGSIAAAIWGLIEIGAPGGIYHWTDLGVASWYDFAVAIQDEALARGLLSRAVPVNPIRSAAYPTRARRPAFSVLDTVSTRTLIKVPARYWRHNLRTMLDELRTT
ncbi:MAG TPA: dTDP-4-dehydrorhamnose reductase [Steroidobacteraceae bacterium]